MTFTILSLLTKNRNVTPLAIFILALIIKLLIFFFATDPIIFYKYPYFVEQINRGFDIGERIIDLSPFYLYINLLFYKIVGANWEVLAVLQIMIGSLNCLIIYIIGEKLFGRNVGIIASVILLLYGNLSLIELTLEPEVFVIFFNSLAVLVLIKAKNENYSEYRAWKWFLAGALIGLSVITKANALLILPGAVIWIWWGVAKRDKKFIATLSLLLGVFLLVSPITLRNYLKFHDLILVTADGGKVFFHGNGPGATGMARADLSHQGFIEEGQTDPDYAHVLFRNTARYLSGLPLSPSACSRFWFSCTLDLIQANPASSLLLELKKFCYFWGNYEVHDLDSTYKNYVTIQSWPFIPFGIIAALGIMGMGLSLARFRQAFLLYWMILVYLLSALVFFAASRYRLPAAPFISIFSAYSLTYFFGLIRDKNWKRFFACMGITLLLFACTNLLFRNDIRIFDQWQKATRIHYSLGGKMLFKKGNYQEAVLEFKKVLELQPDFAPAYNYLGKSFAILNDYERAEQHFNKVIQLTPGIDEGYMNLGLLFELKGEKSKALSYLTKALSLNPQNARAKEHLQSLKGRSPE
jgi:4-amino-4-deoxy-L-arabinose transferase-like glycosyltransferase